MTNTYQHLVMWPSDVEVSFMLKEILDMPERLARVENLVNFILGSQFVATCSLQRVTLDSFSMRDT